MKTYTYQIGNGAEAAMQTTLHSESLYADSLGEAIDKAKSITNHRSHRDDENIVRVVENAADQYPLWASSVEAVRNG